jgi:integrase
MASASITARPTKNGGRRYQVRYRLGGRAYPVQHGGSFATMKEARGRRDLIAGELAAGRNPAEVLRALVEQPQRRTLGEWGEAYWKARKLDLDASSHRSIRADVARIKGAGFGDPETITPSAIQEWVAELAEELKPATIGRYVATLRQVLDFAGIDPNPARHRTIKLPRRTREEPQPPTARHLIALLRRVGPRTLLPLITIEQTAMRVGEAASLVWGDVDAAGNRFRLRARETKTERARWVKVPDWLMAEIEATCPPEDRVTERRVFQGFTETGAWKAMASACKLARIPHYHPHDLRHRRISLWHGQGLPGREVADRAGHAKPSESIDTYSHVMPLTEVRAEVFRALLARAGVVPVWSQASAAGEGLGRISHG